MIFICFRCFLFISPVFFAMAENLSRSELDYPFKLLEYFNGFRVSKVRVRHLFSSYHLGSLVNRPPAFLPPAAPSLSLQYITVIRHCGFLSVGLQGIQLTQLTAKAECLFSLLTISMVCIMAVLNGHLRWIGR